MEVSISKEVFTFFRKKKTFQQKSQIRRDFPKLYIRRHVKQYISNLSYFISWSWFFHKKRYLTSIRFSKKKKSKKENFLFKKRNKFVTYMKNVLET